MIALCYGNLVSQVTVVKLSLHHVTTLSTPPCLPCIMLSASLLLCLAKPLLHFISKEPHNFFFLWSLAGNKYIEKEIAQE